MIRDYSFIYRIFDVFYLLKYDMIHERTIA